MKKWFYAAMLLLGLSIMMVSCNKEDDDSSISKPSGKEKGHAYVDLGLPSGTLWATCNVDASSPEEYGGYYAWGETETKTDYSWETYKWFSGDWWIGGGDYYPVFSKYVTNESGIEGRLDNKTILDPEDDVAYVKWGGKWRMPTLKDFKELQKECAYELVIYNGKNGLKFVGPNGKSIFFPYAGYRYYSSNQDIKVIDGAGNYGYYWASTRNENYWSYYGSGMRIGISGWFSEEGMMGCFEDRARGLGFCIRPVFPKK